MAQGTQRLRYFDRQFLRSGDFTDEQAYHMEMRRRLNLEMGLTGIVSGAGIQIDQNSVPPAPSQRTSDLAASGAASTAAAGVEFLSLGTGYVIDQLGREILISAPTSLTPLLSRAGLKVGPNELWIVYTETASGSPAPGYQLCNELSQNTRWTESFDLILRSLTVAPDPNAPDPNRDLMGICLGIVMVTSGGAGPSFLLPPHWWHRRRYAGIRAQAIVAPDDLTDGSYDFNSATPNVLPPHGYVDVKTKNGVYTDGNMLVRQNMLIGDDFGLDPSKNAPVPLINPGNLKVAQDIFLQGKLYQPDSNGNWVALTDYIKSLSVFPDIQLLPPQPLTFPPNTGVIPWPMPIHTKLSTFSSVDVQPIITSLIAVSGATLSGLNSKSGLTINHSVDHTTGDSTTPVTITVNYQLSVDSLNNGVFDSAIVSCLVVFHP